MTRVEAGLENLLTKSTVFLTILERLEAGYRSAASAVHAGGITTIADLEFPMLDESIDFEFANNILKSSETQFYTYCVPSSRLRQTQDPESHYLIKILPQDEGQSQ